MRKVLSLIMCIPILLFSACDVHEWPDVPEKVQFYLRLSYETDMTKWEHLYDGSNVVEVGLGETYDNHQKYGKMRYIVRAYPVSEKRQISQNYTQEYVFTKDVTEGYNHEMTLELPAGNYQIMVWSDLQEYSSDIFFHNAENFAEIMLQGDHRGNCDHRDAFRGTNSISLVADIMESLPKSLEIRMQRSLAKYEFVTSDVVEFIEKESIRIASKAGEGTSTDDPSTKTVKIENYKVVFYYVGFMPNTYSMYTDKPVDSSTGVMFESTLRKLSDKKASMGFDYVFVNGKESAVAVQIGIYDNEGTQLSLSKPIEIPLKRSHHSILTGNFLMLKASGGVTINPEFNGDHNLIIP